MRRRAPSSVGRQAASVAAPGAAPRRTRGSAAWRLRGKPFVHGPCRIILTDFDRKYRLRLTGGGHACHGEASRRRHNRGRIGEGYVGGRGRRRSKGQDGK